MAFGMGPTSMRKFSVVWGLALDHDIQAGTFSASLNNFAQLSLFSS